MARSKSSGRWLQEHFKDTYVKQAQAEGWPSRAAYKLLEIQEKDQLINKGAQVVDLGAAPGGWSAVAAHLIGGKGKVWALDCLEMLSIPDVHFIKGDFTEDAVFNELMTALDGNLIDCVLSDMAPNMSGVRDVDQAKSMYLCELALDFAQQVLKPGGNFLVKVFQGEGFDDYLKQMRSSFKQVKSRKPKASRDRSREQYLLGLGYISSHKL